MAIDRKTSDLTEPLRVQTSELLNFISGGGRRRSQRVAENAQAVLRNLQGHRDRGEPLNPITEDFLDQAANGLPLQQVEAESTRRVAAFAQGNPRQYMETVLSAITTAVISPKQGEDLLAIIDHPLLESARQQLLLEQQQLEAWGQRQETIAAALLPPLTALLLPLTTVQPAEQTEPELEPPRESVFNLLVRAKARQAPRRILKKLKKVKRA